MSEPITITLREPVQAHGETVTALTLRKPSGKDIRQSGYPVRFGAGGEATILSEPMARLIAALAGVPPSTIDQLTLADWNEAAMAVTGFFGV